jgi:hypothetical protein
LQGFLIGSVFVVSILRIQLHYNLIFRLGSLLHQTFKRFRFKLGIFWGVLSRCVHHIVSLDHCILAIT